MFLPSAFIQTMDILVGIRRLLSASILNRLNTITTSTSYLCPETIRVHCFPHGRNAGSLSQERSTIKQRVWGLTKDGQLLRVRDGSPAGVVLALAGVVAREVPHDVHPDDDALGGLIEELPVPVPAHAAQAARVPLQHVTRQRHPGAVALLQERGGHYGRHRRGVWNEVNKGISIPSTAQTGSRVQNKFAIYHLL